MFTGEPESSQMPFAKMNANDRVHNQGYDLQSKIMLNHLSN